MNTGVNINISAQGTCVFKIDVRHVGLYNNKAN